MRGGDSTAPIRGPPERSYASDTWGKLRPFLPISFYLTSLYLLMKKKGMDFEGRSQEGIFFFPLERLFRFKEKEGRRKYLTGPKYLPSHLPEVENLVTRGWGTLRILN